MPDEEAVSLSSDAESNCRICYCATDEALCTPCKCTGSVLFVHQSCMDRWVELRPSDWNGKCDVCQYKLRYEDTEVSQGAVSWSVYFSALGKYILCLSSFIFPVSAIFVSFLVNMKRMSDHEDSMVYLALSSTVVNLQMASFIIKYLKLPLIQRRLQWAKCPLPKIGHVKCPKKIRATTYRDVFRSEIYYAFAVIAIILISTGFVQSVAPFLPKAQRLNATEAPTIVEEVPEEKPSKWTKKQMEMEGLAIFLIGVFALLEFSSVLIIPFYEFLNRCVRNLLAFAFGKLFNHVITAFFVGWYTDCYNSALIAGTFFFDVAAGQVVVLELTEMFLTAYGGVLNTAAHPNLLRFPIQNVTNKYKKGLVRVLRAIMYISLFMVVFIIVPLNLTKWFVSSMTPLNMKTYDSKGIADTLFGQGHNRSDFLIKMFEGLNRAVHTMFVVNVISYAFPVWTLLYTIFRKIYVVTGVTKNSRKFDALNFLLFSFTSLLFTATTLFALFIGRSVLCVFDSSSYYSNDITALGVGWLLMRIPGTTVHKAIRTTGIAVTCFCNAMIYFLVIRLLIESYTPIRVETIFFASWLFIDPRHNKPDKDIFMHAWTSMQRFAITVVFLLPLYAGVWSGILPSSLEMVKSFSSFKWFFLGYSLGVLLICLAIYSVYLLWKLNYHLRCEYEEISSVLLNYNPEREESPPSLFLTKVKPYRDYSLCGYARHKLSSFSKKGETGTDETVLENVL